MPSKGQRRASPQPDSFCPRGLCDHPECSAEGLYRAPKARDRLNEYFWFCLEHVRDYNKAWNYCAGMAQNEIESHIRNDTVWQRPTWPLGRWGAGGRFGSKPRPHDGFGEFFTEKPRRERAAHPGANAGEETARAEERAQSSRGEHNKALAILDLQPPSSLSEIKTRYKTLVKRFHPDANGGDKAAEEHLKVINQAYSTLKNSFAS